MNTQCVVFVIEALTVGGAEQMLVAMANRFAARGWEVHMICLTKSGELTDRLEPAVARHVLDKSPGVDWRLPGKLRGLIKSIDPTVVNSHLWTANSWTRFSLIGSGYKVVVTEHSRDFWKSSAYRFVDRRLARFTHRLVAVSNDTADFYRSDVGIASNLVTVINNGIDTVRFVGGDGQALRQELSSSPGFEDAEAQTVLLGTIGRMVGAKNHPRLVEAYALMREQCPNTHLVLVGDGPERERVEQSVAEHNMETHITLLGARSDIADILAALDIFVLSSDREGHPLTALEAQAAGTPVILTKAGGSADAIAESDDEMDELAGGLLVEKSVPALAEAMIRLCQDTALRARMGQFAQTHARSHFDLESMVDQYEAVFR